MADTAHDHITDETASEIIRRTVADESTNAKPREDSREFAPEVEATPAEPTWPSIMEVIEEEIAVTTPGPDAPEPKTLSEKIQADPELSEVLSRRPELCEEFKLAAATLDQINSSVGEYLTSSNQGFERMLWALVEMEVEHGDDGKPIITPEGQFKFMNLDEKQRTVFERFLSWQRKWYLWPQLENNIQCADKMSAAAKRAALEAITQTRIILGESFPQSAGVC